MASCRSSWHRRFLQRALPFLFRRCPAGNYHWRWDALCWCRVAEHDDSWHGGVLVFQQGMELIPYKPPQNEDDGGEAPCRPGGNYGLCRTHPTCEMVHRRLMDAEQQIVRLRTQLGRDA